jgi:cold shock CspA family protein
MERKSGTVVHLVKEKGYWFILFEGRRIFCHVSNWSEVEMPSVGDHVSFELGPARQTSFSHQAINVTPAEINAGLKTLAGGTQ